MECPTGAQVFNTHEPMGVLLIQITTEIDMVETDENMDN